MAEPVPRPVSDPTDGIYTNSACSSTEPANPVQPPDTPTHQTTSPPPTPPSRYGTPPPTADPSRPIIKRAFERFTPPWGDWPDSFGLYTDPIFPMPSTTLFTGNEEHDFCESVAEWFDWQHGVERREGDEVVKRLWKEREKDKVEYWLQYGAVPGTEVWERKGVGR